MDSMTIIFNFLRSQSPTFDAQGFVGGGGGGGGGGGHLDPPRNYVGHKP